jgi:hypothetical protein
MLSATSDATTVYLVSCVSKKRPYACAAQDLYVSDLFNKSRRYVEASGCPWFILSAEYGLVSPHQVIASYERTLNTMGVADRKVWAQRVFADLIKTVPNLSQVVFLAGMRYREFLAERLVRLNVEVSVPMQGLSIGKQLSWLGSNVPK